LLLLGFVAGSQSTHTEIAAIVAHWVPLVRPVQSESDVHATQALLTQARLALHGVVALSRHATQV
jgi:hypothetical protein